MRKRGWTNQIAFFLYDRQIGNDRISRMKKSFQEVSGILQGDKKNRNKKAAGR